MRTVVICVCHDHETTVAKLGYILVFLALLETKDLLEIVELLVPCKLCHRSISDIFTFPSKRENAIEITTNHRETSDSECLSRVTLCDNKGAIFGLRCSSYV